jgi:hypothetical protein
MITVLWKKSLQLWEFRNDESHKDEVRSVAEYKQHALDKKIRESYRQKYTLLHPLNTLQETLFEIQIEEIIIMSYSGFGVILDSGSPCTLCTQVKIPIWR